MHHVEKNTSTDSSRSISLSETHGEPLKVLIEPPEDKKKTISVGDVLNLKNTYNFSLRTTKGVVSSFKNATSEEKKFEGDVINKLVSKNHDMDKVFQVEKLEFIQSKATVQTSVTEHLVYCNDVMSFVTHIEEQQQITDEKVHLKIGTDGGGGFFKMTPSVQLMDNEIKKM